MKKRTISIFLFIFLYLTSSLSAQTVEEFATVCYSEYHSDGYDEITGKNTKHGFAGVYKGLKYYYEEWITPSSPGTDIFYLFLRTDTTEIDTLDFCFVELPVPDNIPADTVVFHKQDKQNGGWIVDSSMTVDKFPTNFQPILFSLIGYYALSDINSKENGAAKIYFKGDNLYLQFWDAARYGDSRLLLWIYKNNGKQFKFSKERVLKTVKQK